MVEKIAGAEVGKEVVFDQVLLIDDGAKTQIGTPYIEGATITASFLEEGKGKKIHGLKFKSKSRYTRRYGHRQALAKVEIKRV